MSFDHKLDRILSRTEELRFMLSGALAGDAFVKASKELSELTPIEERIAELRAAEKAQAEAQMMLADPEMKDLASAELEDLKQQIPELEMSLRLALLPKDEMDDRSAILEIRDCSPPNSSRPTRNIPACTVINSRSWSMSRTSWAG
jgi:peptide chain release factor 1